MPWSTKQLDHLGAGVAVDQPPALVVNLHVHQFHAPAVVRAGQRLVPLRLEAGDLPHIVLDDPLARALGRADLPLVLRVERQAVLVAVVLLLDEPVDPPQPVRDFLREQAVLKVASSSFT